MQKEMFFKASRKASRSHGAYRQILKRDADGLDLMSSFDDVIRIPWYVITKEWNIEYRKISAVSIDCDKKTGEFRLFIQYTD